MKIGLHVSIKGGIHIAPKRAFDLGCECFQFFSRSPHGGFKEEISDETAKIFQEECKKYQYKDYYIHSPYYINLASSNNKVYYGSISAIKKEMELANRIQAKYVITHLGSAKDLGEEDALQKTSKALNLMFQNYKGKALLLIEMSAGAGMVIGDNFDEIAKILKEVKEKKFIGICFDTAHSFESGYDLRTKEKVKHVFDQFDERLGLEKLKLIHCNDSKTEFNSHSDRHENIGEGEIGYEGLKAVIRFAKAKKINVIAETPYKSEEGDRENLKKLKVMRDNS